jgi:polysaccharide chain length determinant protein (PEP-CTERM system associated)
MEKPELTMEDYLAMARRRLNIVLVPLLVAPIAGFLISYIFSPRYTSQSMILVEGQKVPSTYVTPVITSDFTQRISTLQEQILSNSRLRPVVQSLGLVKPGDEGKLMENIRTNTTVTPVITSISEATATLVPGGKKPTPSANNEPLPGFYINYTDSDKVRAQKVCAALTSLMIDENLRSRIDTATETTKFLDRQVEEAKRTIDDQDEKLAQFKNQHMGELPTDIDTNMKMLGSLNSQLDATTQNLNRAQQDKSYAESMLAQQIAVWKSSQSSLSPQTLEQQLAVLQAQLMQLQARYTDDYPDVIKTKADIAKVQARLDEVHKQMSSPAAEPNEGTNANGAEEPPEVRQLRLQIHQLKDVIDQSTQDQKKLQQQINVYQARTAMSPAIEEQYRVLTRDYDNAQSFYRDLLAKKSSADVATNMENAQQGEQFAILAPAALPTDPSFPNRIFTAAAGLGAGLGLGLLLAVWLEFSDRSIRTEKDIAAAMDLPMLISVPWLGPEEEMLFGTNGNGNGRRPFWRRADHATEGEKIGV